MVCTAPVLRESLPVDTGRGMSPSQQDLYALWNSDRETERLQVLCTSRPPIAPWESWSSRLFDYEQPNSPATPSDTECATYFTEASLLPPEAYLCSEAYTQEAYIDLESQYCSDEDADKQDLQYRLLVGGLRSSRKAPSSRLGSRKHSGTQAKLIRKPCKTRYAFEIADPSRAAKQPEARQTSAGTEFYPQACMCTAHFTTWHMRLHLQHCSATATMLLPQSATR